MFGCVRRLGCLVLLVALAAAGYWYWLSVQGRETAPAPAGTWRAVTTRDAAGGASVLSSLDTRGGRVFANLTPAQAVSYLLVRSGHELPARAEDVQAMVHGDTLYARALVSLQDLGGGRVLGPVARLVSARDTVLLGGTVDLLRPGLAEFRVTRVALRNLEVPPGAIPNLVRQLRRPGADSSGLLAPNALPIPLPPYIGDIRIAGGKVTLYKNVSQ